MFKKILIANRGEIALRIIRACKELGIKTVAVHSEVDGESLHVKFADESVCIGKADSRESYLNIPAILSAAEITNADAIHPGYGFLAENSEFANVCEKCGVTFIGPSSESIGLMGDKIRAREVMKSFGLKITPGAEIDTNDKKTTTSKIEEIGFPVIIKAAAGGGGRGMKIVNSMDNFWTILSAAKSEALAAFGNSTVYVEKYINNARHVEFQIIADKFGNAVHLGERDCSIQRRYQKVIEETPCPVVDSSTRDRIGRMTAQAVSKAGYTNAGTVEFLMGEDKQFYFLEMNTRVQVEHPITEMVTGIDIVKTQIHVANGEPLELKQEDIHICGHALECRINAEDPMKFFPSAGLITGWHVPGGLGVRVDAAAYSGYTISPYYDSLIAKLITYGSTRGEAINKMRVALDEFLIEGIKSNIPLHRIIMSDEKYINAQTSTSYLPELLNKLQEAQTKP
jgi:acetyl-CoA carboxylase, biotin carboxylase subunit